LVVLTLTGCSRDKDKNKSETSDGKIKIGLSFDTFVIERWQRERDVFVSTAQDLGADVNVQNANGNVEEQISQIKYFIENKMDVIVVIAIDSKACSQILKKAKSEGIIVIDYDRLINDSDANLYISFDNVKVGELNCYYHLGMC
jgi:D-xylose transport system substrate-binding protein